jgi:hypothetical protein
MRLLPVGQQHQDADAALWLQAFLSAANLGAAKKVGFQLLAAIVGLPQAFAQDVEEPEGQNPYSRGWLRSMWSKPGAPCSP